MSIVALYTIASITFMGLAFFNDTENDNCTTLDHGNHDIHIIAAFVSFTSNYLLIGVLIYSFQGFYFYVYGLFYVGLVSAICFGISELIHYPIALLEYVCATNMLLLYFFIFIFFVNLVHKKQIYFVFVVQG